jgi:hypothetical protein
VVISLVNWLKITEVSGTYLTDSADGDRDGSRNVYNFNQMTQLIALEDFINFNGREIFMSYFR